MNALPMPELGGRKNAELELGGPRVGTLPSWSSAVPGRMAPVHVQ